MKPAFASRKRKWSKELRHCRMMIGVAIMVSFAGCSSNHGELAWLENLPGLFEHSHNASGKKSCLSMTGTSGYC